MKILKSKNARHAESVRDLKIIGIVLKGIRGMLMKQFLVARENCKHRKRTKWSFQKTSCKRSAGVAHRNIGPCLLDRCPIVNSEKG